MSDSPGTSTPLICIPISEITEMLPEQIGNSVLALIDAARATQLINITDWWINYLFRLSNDVKKAAIALADKNQMPELKEFVRDLERLSSSDEEVTQAYSKIRQILDETYRYLITKPSKLTPTQLRAKANILDLRHGCKLCGLLDGQHTASCIGFTQRRAPSST
jgi:hypothetical protein